ncbi:MAG: type 4b pilus protein PilO2 [Bdellovibrionales bacterium]
MAGGVVTVGRRSYAVGLYWENSPSGNVAQAAKEAAHQSGQSADFYAVRSGAKDGRVPQFGLLQADGRCGPAMPVFAGCLANQQPGSWAGAFRLREGTVITVVRDDLIVPDGDQLYENESDARDRLLQEIGFGGLQRIYAPESWAIPGGDSMPVSLLLDKAVDVRLRPVTIPRSWYVGAVAALVACALMIFLAWLANERSIEENERLAALRAAQRRAQEMIPNIIQPAKPDYPPPERVWEKKPVAMQVIKACQESLAKVPVVSAGWRISAIKCSDSSLQITWGRDRGMGIVPPAGSPNDTVSSSTTPVPFPKLDSRGPEDLWKQQEISKRYLEQNWPGRVARAPDDPPPPKPPDYQGEWNPPPAPWVKRSFTITVANLPAGLPLFFGGIPGLIINSLSLTSGSKAMEGVWTIEGVIYENRM